MSALLLQVASTGIFFQNCAPVKTPTDTTEEASNQTRIRGGVSGSGYGSMYGSINSGSSSRGSLGGGSVRSPANSASPTSSPGSPGNSSPPSNQVGNLPSAGGSVAPLTCNLTAFGFTKDLPATKVLTMRTPNQVITGGPRESALGTLEVFTALQRGRVTYTWYKDDQPLTYNKITYTRYSGLDNILQINGRDYSVEGTYHVIAQDESGARLRSQSTRVTVQESAEPCTAGEHFTLSADPRAVENSVEDAAESRFKNRKGVWLQNSRLYDLPDWQAGELGNMFSMVHVSKVSMPAAQHRQQFHVYCGQVIHGINDTLPYRHIGIPRNQCPAVSEARKLTGATHYGGGCTHMGCQSYYENHFFGGLPVFGASGALQYYANPAGMHSCMNSNTPFIGQYTGALRFRCLNKKWLLEENSCQFVTGSVQTLMAPNQAGLDSGVPAGPPSEADPPPDLSRIATCTQQVITPPPPDATPPGVIFTPSQAIPGRPALGQQ
jgi:hypothetical protein